MNQKQGQFRLWLESAFFIEGISNFFAGIFLCTLWCNVGDIQGWLRSHKETSYGLVFLLVAIAVIGTLYHMRKKRKRPMHQGGGWMPLGVLASGLIFDLLGYVETPNMIGILICCSVVFLLDYILWDASDTISS